ncbi:hypothetical protein B0H14DRAFT_3124960 [Mycena olivaceomarginata]|nr:hypothetical protein B0H14DRAFT_3124960 [Mycena olivaceomarginata]
MMFLDICTTWTAIALTTRALWSAIHIPLPCAEGMAELLPIWFRRAGTRGISISLRGDLTDVNHRVSDFIWKHTERLQHLELWDEPDDDDYGDDDKPGINLYRDTTSGPLPLLETLTVGSFSGDIRHIFRLLRLAPNIVECYFDSVEHSLAFAGKGNMVKSMAATENILDNFTLPSLEAIDIRAFYYPLDRFLKRSAPPLREMVLRSHPKNSDKLCEYLHLILSLERLEIWWPVSGLVARLFAALADSSMLPNLRSMAVFPMTAGETSFFRVIYPYTSLSTDVLASFGELVADGVHIRTEEHNLIDLPAAI